MADVEELVCSFREILGSQCGFHPKDRSQTVDVIPLLYCTRPIDGHKSALAFTGVENEVDLILSRASVFSPPRNIEQLNICPRHRESLGLSWRRPSARCSVPAVLSSHSVNAKERPKAERGLSKLASQFIMKETGIFIPVGSGKKQQESNCVDLKGGGGGGGVLFMVATLSYIFPS